MKRLTELQAGQVGIASDGAGRGTAVTIQFPLVADPPRQGPTMPPVTGLLHEVRGLRILIVDDVDDARETTQVMLERLGTDVLVAKGGLEALEMIALGKPDLVLCDLRIPQMDGFEFLRALYLDPNGRCPPVIAITGLASSADHLRSRAAGFAWHLDKPFDDVALLAAIDAVIPHRV